MIIKVKCPRCQGRGTLQRGEVAPVMQMLSPGSNVFCCPICNGRRSFEDAEAVKVCGKNSEAYAAMMAYEDVKGNDDLKQIAMQLAWFKCQINLAETSAGDELDYLRGKVQGLSARIKELNTSLKKEEKVALIGRQFGDPELIPIQKLPELIKGYAYNSFFLIRSKLFPEFAFFLIGRIHCTGCRQYMKILLPSFAGDLAYNVWCDDCHNAHSNRYLVAKFKEAGISDPKMFSNDSTCTPFNVKIYIRNKHRLEAKKEIMDFNASLKGTLAPLCKAHGIRTLFMMSYQEEAPECELFSDLKIVDVRSHRRHMHDLGLSDNQVKTATSWFLWLDQKEPGYYLR